MLDDLNTRYAQVHFTSSEDWSRGIILILILGHIILDLLESNLSFFKHNIHLLCKL